MGLKKDIVIVNEYTVKTRKGGSRGGTPGDYVLRYMARDGAVEDLTPVRMDTENFINRYMARAEAVDEAVSVLDLKNDMRSIQGNGGVAFGYGDFSLSHKKLKAAAKDIQRNFDAGKTVMKTVLSFEESYLREHGIISPDFEFDRPGDYRGNIDQMKLRMAIMNGLDKFGKDYDDLQYIGVIQVDTKHVHCHLAMVDRGVGNLTVDGTQRGKILDRGKQDIRRGINDYLDEKQSVKMMSSNIDQDRRNTVCFVKKYTHRMIEERGFAQFMIACLPEDKQLWRAGTNRQEMQKPNAIMREYVQQLLQQPDSGYNEALHHVDRYAKSRSQTEDLSGQAYRELYRRGNERIIEESMNCVYSILKQIPESELRVRTPMMEVMAMPYEDLANEQSNDPIIEFGFKLRSYKSRLDHHKQERRKYHEAVMDYERREQEGNADAASRPLLDFFKEEEEYNTMLMSKYQHFLNFVPPADTYQDGLEELHQYHRRISNTRRMLRDVSMRHMSPDRAERYGERVYQESGGRYVVTDQDSLERRLQDMSHHLEMMRREYAFDIAEQGMTLDENDEIQFSPQYDFDQVKALDMHHLMYDFPYNFEVSLVNTKQFNDATDRRYRLFQRAKQYLIDSGQEDALQSLPEKDIELQKSVSDQFRSDGILHTRRTDTSSQRDATRTIRIDYDAYYQQEDTMKNYIKESIKDLQFD